MSQLGKFTLLAISLVGSILDEFQNNSTMTKATAKFNEPRNNELEELVIVFLEKAKVWFETGVPEYNIPPLDPIVFDAAIIHLNNTGVFVGDLEFSISVMTGLSNFNTTSLVININKPTVIPLDVDMEITFNDLQFVTNYALDGKWPNQNNLTWNGLLALQLKTFKINLKLSTGMKCGIFILDKFSFNFNLKSSDVFVTGLLNNENLSSIISILLSGALPLITNIYSDVLNNIIASTVRAFLNRIFAFLLFEA